MRTWVSILAPLAALVGCAPPAPSPIAAGLSDGGDDAGGAIVGTPTPAADASGGADAVAPVDAAAPPADAGPPPPPAAYVTTDDLSRALSPAPLTMGDQGTADAVVTIDPSVVYQSVVGFGASITDSSSYVMTKYLSAAARGQTLAKLFDPVSGIGLSFLRQPMGASDFSTVGNFSYDDGTKDPTLASFSIAQDLKATVPVLKQALALNSRLFVMATPWSPPAWMKNNASMDGTGGAPGSSGLAGDASEPLAQYFVKFLQAYAGAGVVVGAVTPQNEPLNGGASYPGMDLNAPSELTLIAQHLGPALESAGLSTLIWAYDHNWDVETYPEQVIGDATAGGFTEGAAFHCYGGAASAMTTFHRSFPQKSIYMTECSGGDWQGDPFADTIELAIDSTANWARAVALWNLALDENKGPQNGGCATCRGVITVNSQSGEVTYNADYYALGHFSKFVLPGAVRIGSSSSSGALHQVAFRNASGRVAVVAHNTGSGALTVRVGTGATAMSVPVPANAAVTFDWSP